MKKSIKKALLAVSFGTSYRDNCEKTIGAVERALRRAYPDYEVRRAFTSRMIRQIWKKREGIWIDSVGEALEKLAEEGFDTVIIQPTHMINGEENDAMLADAALYTGRFRQLSCAAPALTGVEDYKKMARVLMNEIPEWTYGDTAVVLMGHGTSHHANAAYAALEYRLMDEGCSRMFVGTVEGYPDLEAVLKRVKQSGLNKVVLYPLMIVAGDHVNHDMAGDEEGSWKQVFLSVGFDVRCVLRGLGEYEGIGNIFAEHAGTAMDR